MPSLIGLYGAGLGCDVQHPVTFRFADVAFTQLRQLANPGTCKRT